VSAQRLDSAGLAAVGLALADPDVVARYAAKVVTVPRSECRWWTGAGVRARPRPVLDRAL